MRILCEGDSRFGSPFFFAADFTKDPTFCNFADPKNYAYELAAMQNPAAGKRNGYTNINESNSYDAGFFVQYEEGIYVGYRYYETAADIGKAGFVYEEEVVYPFGHGLSYTQFEQQIVRSDLSGSTKTVDVRVKNIGPVSGKCAVQLYAEAPYTDYDRTNGVEKSTVNLVAFGKTKELAAGEEQTLTLTFAQDDLTSYDAVGAKAYILDEGDYLFTLRSDSHNTVLYGGKEQQVVWHNPEMKIYNEENDGARLSEKNARQDNRKYMDIDAMIRAGADVALCTTPLELADSTSATAVRSLREASRHLLYATVNSSAMNGLVPGTIVSYTMAPWRILLVTANVVVYVFVAACVTLLVLRGIDAKRHPENYKPKKKR